MDLNEIHEKLGSAETTKDYLKLYCDLFKILSKKSREDNGAFLSVTPLVSKALVDLNIQDAELQQRILLSLGLLLCKNNPVELPMPLKQQAMKDVVNVLMVTSDKSVTFRSYWCLSQFLDAGLEMEESMVFNVLASIESVQSSCMRNITLYGEACGLLQKMIEKNIDGLFKHVKQLTKLVLTPVFHAVSKIREISYKTLQLATPILQSGNDNSSAPVGAVVLDLVKKMLDDMLHLFRNKNEIYVLEVWKIVVNILGQSLHKNVNAINGLLSVVEKGFKHESQEVKLKSFDAWKTLISNFALSEEVICIPKKLRLLLQPLLRISSTKTEAVIQAKCDTWWHIAWSLGDKIPNHFELVCLPLLEFVCGTSFKDNGSQQRIMRQKGCEILIRFLEQPLSGTFLHSPKKAPTISISPLKKPVAAVIFGKFPKEFVKATGAVIKEFGKEQQMLSHIDYLLKLILYAISNTPHDASKDCIDAIASFVQLVVDIVKCQLCPPLLCSKLVDKVSQLPKKMLTAHYYYVGSTGVMHGNLYLTILSLLLHPTFLTMPDFKQRVVPLFQRLAGSSIKSSLSPLSYAHSIILFMKEQTVINNCDAEVLLNLWSAVSSALFAAVQETLEISGGSCFEQDFACMYDVLTYPFEYILILNTTQGQFKTILTKSWGDMYKLFYRCSALLPSTDNNSACDGICSQLLKCLNKDNIENSSICEVLSHILPIIVECVDFKAVGKNSGKGGFSAEKWAKSKQNPLGNIAPLIDVIKWFLTYFHETMSSESSSKDKDAQQSTIKFAVMYLEILNTFISKITSSTALFAVLDQVAEPLSKVYEFSCKKNIGTKKNVHAFLIQLEILWKTITTNIQVYYTAQYDSDFLQILAPLLEVNLRHHKQEIKDRTRQFWFASFAPNQSKLEYPPSLKEVLKKLRPPLIPGSDTSPIEEDSSFTGFSEDQAVIMPPLPEKKDQLTPSVVKLSFPVLRSPTQNTRKINEDNSPSAKTKTPGKAKPDKVSIDDLPEEEFVEIKVPAPPSKKILTRRQKEALKKKSYVPALYSELSQNSISMDYSLDTQDTQDSCSVISLSQDENEVPVIVQFQDSMEAKQVQEGEQESPAPAPSDDAVEKKAASSSAKGNGEKEKSGDLHIAEPMEPIVDTLEQDTKPLEPTELNEDVPNSPATSVNASPEVQVVEIEVIDLGSQSDTDAGENVMVEQGNVEKEANSHVGDIHIEVENTLNVKSVDKMGENVTEGSDLQNHSLQQVTDATVEGKSESKDSGLCDNIRLNSSVLHDNKQSGIVEYSSVLSEDMDVVADSEEIIPSSQSSSEGDYETSKDSGLLYRFKGVQKTTVSNSSSVPQIVFCNKPVLESKVVSSDGNDTVSAKATRMLDKSISGDKLNSSPVVISARKINTTLEHTEKANTTLEHVEKANTTLEHTEKANTTLEHTEKANVIPDSKENEMVIQESLLNGCETDSEKISSPLEETKMKETTTPISANEICDKDVNVWNSLSKEDVKKKLYVELPGHGSVCNTVSLSNGEGKNNTVNGHCGDSPAKGKRHLKVEKSAEKSSSLKKAASKAFSENITKGKSSHSSPIIISVGVESSYIKTRRQVFQHSPLLTRSKLKSSNVTTGVLNLNSSARKKGSKKGVSVRSPKKNAEGSVAHNLFSEAQNSESENSCDISVTSVIDVQECLSMVEEPEVCKTKDTVQNVDSGPEKSNNSDIRMLEVLSSDVEVKSVICADVENDKNETDMKPIADNPENSNEIKCTDNNGGTDNLNLGTVQQICKSDDSFTTSVAVCDAKEKELNNLSDNTVCEMSSVSPSHSDKSGDFTVKISPVVEEEKSVSCEKKVIIKDDNSVDQIKSNISQLPTKVEKPCDVECDDHTVIQETQNLVSDKVIPSDTCENPNEEFSVDMKNLMCLEKNDEVKPMLDQEIKLHVGIDENTTTVNETVSEKSESTSQVKSISSSSEVPIPLSPVSVSDSKGSAENEGDSNKSVQISVETSGLLESSVSHSMHDEQIHHYNNHTEVGHHAAATSHVPCAVEDVCMETTGQSDKSCIPQEKDAIGFEHSSSDAHSTAQNETSDVSSSHKVTIVNLSIEKSDEAIKEPEIQVDNLKRCDVSEEIPAICAEMILTEDRKDAHKGTPINAPSPDDIDKESVISESDSTHKDAALEKSETSESDSTHKDAALEKSETSDSDSTRKDAALEKSETSDSEVTKTDHINEDEPIKISPGVMGSESPSEKIMHNQSVSAIFVPSVSSDVERDAPSIYPFMSNRNCDNELSLSPCSGAKKRKQKTPSNSCVAIDIKRKKLELRSKREACEKLSTLKQISGENTDRLVSPAKHTKTEDTSLSSKTSSGSSNSIKSIPEKFMQLWHSSITMNSDDNVTVQEKKQKLPPERLKHSSPSSKNNQLDLEPDKTVSEEIRTEETSSSSVLRDVRNSPQQWRSPSSSVISIPVSPLSRSQRMVRAARKHMNSPDTAKQSAYSRATRTALLESPSTSKTSLKTSENSKVSSPVYTSILKKRTYDSSSTPSPPHKKRKVSFADPLVQGEMIIEPYDNENSCRARRTAKRCLQMNRDNSLRNKEKIFWCNQDQEKSRIQKKSQRFSNSEVANSGTAVENGSSREKLVVSEIKKSEKPEFVIVVKERIDRTRSEQNNVILDKVSESTCPPPVAFSTSQLSPTSSLTSSDIPSSDVYENSEDFNCDSQAIVFEELVGCSEPVNCIIPLLTSPMWVRGLSQLLLSRKINTIGDISGLTVQKLKELPIKSPKLETVRNILRDYVIQRLKSSSCKLNTASSSSPKKCDSSGEKTDVMQTSADCQDDVITVSVKGQPAIPVEPGENSESVQEADSSSMEVESGETSRSPCETDSQGQLGEENDKDKCREMIAKLCNSQVIHEMPLVLLCDLLMKVTNGIKAKSCQNPQEEEK